jgi:hypothetical protein
MHADSIRPAASPILRNLRFALLLPLAALLACGSSPSSPSSTTSSTTSAPTPAPYNFNGTWRANAPEYLGSIYQAYLPIFGLSGPLQASNGVVSGTFYASTHWTYGNPNLCPAISTLTGISASFPVTGTLDDSHDLVLTVPIEGGTGTLYATLGNDPAAYTYGSWRVDGGSCATTATSMVIQGTPTAPTPITTPSPITANLSGNWQITANYVAYNTLPTVDFSGSLQFSNGSVTGMLTASGNNGQCYFTLYGTAATSVAGTLDANNNLTLTTSVAGGTATITAVLPSNPQTLADGSYQIVGGPCATAATPMIITQYAPLTGTYVGNFNFPSNDYGTAPAPGTSTTVTAVLTQSSAANANGQFPITGTITATGACTATMSYAGFAYGGMFSDTEPYLTAFAGSFNPDASTIYFADYIDGTCAPFDYGFLTRQ